MQNSSGTALLCAVFGAIFLLVAIASTLSKVTLGLFNPWLGRQIRYKDNPRTFIVVVFLYWFFGVAAMAVAVASALAKR